MLGLYFSPINRYVAVHNIASSPGDDSAAILISTLAAVIWYVLAMMCLLILRRKEPALARPYLTPVYPWMPIFVALAWTLRLV